MTITENQHLRSNYSDGQLRDALITATEVTGKIFIRGRTNNDGAFTGTPTEQAIADFHTLLNVLDTLNQDGSESADQTATSAEILHAASDEWLPTSLDNITMMDEAVLALYADGTGIQGKPHNTTDDTPDSVCLSINGQAVCVSRDDVENGKVVLYRIPAPVQHPDPKVHAVIIVSGAYDIAWDHAYAYVSDGTGYNIVEPLNSDSRLLPEAIHNWSPAKVVEDDR